jgi:hypothetical protein
LCQRDTTQVRRNSRRRHKALSRKLQFFMTTPFKFIILTLAFSLTLTANAQTPKPVDYFANIKNHDLTKLWRADSIQTEGDRDKIAFPEPLGYIGDNFQRFYIHYISVTKSKENPYQYKVYGKTKVKDNICSFSGTITVRKAMLYKESDDPRYKQGSVICDVVFYEDSTKLSSGVIKGTLTSDFQLDKEGKLQYDALMLVADGYYNNQCKATWTSYKTGKSKKCNWGDFRMPDSKELDSGAGDVSINEKYINNGWSTFVAVYSADGDKAKKALQIERAKWWK